MVYGSAVLFFLPCFEDLESRAMTTQDVVLCSSD